MKYEDLKNLMENGKLTLNKRELNPVYREKGWRGQKWDDTTQASWNSQLIKYRRFQYECRAPDMPENQFYKITKKDYEELSKLL
ncbi:MAG: hypothetical protein AABW67_03090 [Nanoarchaeota archaeon]